MRLQVVTWHDGNPAYGPLVTALTYSAASFNIPFRVREWPRQSSIQDAQRLRLETLSERLEAGETDCLLVLDADCLILARPTLLLDCHNALPLDGCQLGFPRHCDRWASGVWVVNPGPVAREFVTTMRRLWSEDPDAVERAVLNAALDHLGQRGKAYVPFTLPLAYGWVEPLHSAQVPRTQAVIEHYCVNLGGWKTLDRRDAGGNPSLIRLPKPSRAKRNGN